MKPEVIAKPEAIKVRFLNSSFLSNDLFISESLKILQIVRVAAVGDTITVLLVLQMR